MAFSPDSSKLAVAQSDNIVFIYKLGSKWGEKKTICNKYPQTSTISCLCWPSSHSNEIFFGLADGKVKLGNLRNNKSVVVYPTDDFVVSMCTSPDGTRLIAGHLDGSIYLFSVSSTGTVSKVSEKKVKLN
jgi:intraflagellar transport protein 172